MTLIAKEKITHNGRSFEVGDVLKGLSNSESERLLRLKSAEEVDASKFVEFQTAESVDPVDGDSITPKEFAELKEKLDKAANKEPLISAADSVGVELNDEQRKKKETVIEEIIYQDLVEEVLEELNEGE